MKFSLALILMLSSSPILAKNVGELNRVLIEDVQRDLKTDNDLNLKTKPSRMRAPASVDVREDKPVQEKIPFEKRNIRQTGSEKW